LKVRVINGLKDGLFVFVGAILIAFILNFINLDFDDNRIWTALGNLGLIKLFDDNQLNGLVILGFILGVFAFALGFSSDKNQNS
jgi:hypothetical protein